MELWQAGILRLGLEEKEGGESLSHGRQVTGPLLACLRLAHSHRRNNSRRCLFVLVLRSVGGAKSGSLFRLFCTCHPPSDFLDTLMPIFQEPYCKWFTSLDRWYCICLASFQNLIVSEHSNWLTSFLLEQLQISVGIDFKWVSSQPSGGCSRSRSLEQKLPVKLCQKKTKKILPELDRKNVEKS